MSNVNVKFGATDDGLSATITKVKTGITNIDSSSTKAASNFDSSFKKMAITAGIAGAAAAAAYKLMSTAAAAARNVVSKFGEAIDFGSKIDDLTQQTGVAGDQLVILGRAFDNSGIGAEKLGTKINRMQRFIDNVNTGASEQVKTLGRLGLKMEDVQGKTPTETMQILAEKLRGVVDPGQRAAMAMEIFGGRSADVLPLINNLDEELDKAKGQVGSFADIMGRSHGQFDTLSDNLGVLRGKTMEFAAGLLEKALPSLNAFTNALTGVDAASFGTKLMDQILKFADALIGAFKMPMAAIELLGEALNLAGKKFVNLLVNSAITFKNTFVEFWKSEIISTVKDLLADGMMFAFAKSMEYLVRKTNDFVMAFEEMLGTSFSSAANFFNSQLFESIKSFALDFGKALISPTAFIGDQLSSNLLRAGKEGAVAFKSGFESSNKTILGQLEAGFGSASNLFSDNLLKGQKKLSQEFGGMIERTEVSAKDFFGAEGSLEKIREGFDKLSEEGRKFREQFEDLPFDMMAHMKDDVVEAGNAMGNMLLWGKGVQQLDANNLKNDVGKAKDDMIQIRNIGDLIKAQDAAAPMKKFHVQVKEARADLVKLKAFLGGDFSRLSITGIAEKLGIPVAMKDQKTLFAEIQAELAKIKAAPVDIQIKKDAAKEDIADIAAKVAEEFGAGKPFELHINADKAIAKLKEDLKDNVDIAINGTKGTKILETINTAVQSINRIIGIIEPKLPTPSLI